MEEVLEASLDGHGENNRERRDEAKTYKQMEMKTNREERIKMFLRGY